MARVHHHVVFDLQITLPSYIQAPATAVPPPATAVPPVISAQQTDEELPAAAEHRSSPGFPSCSQPHDMDIDEASAAEHHHHAAQPYSHKHCSESKTVPGAFESLSAVTADQSRGAVEAGPDQCPASSGLRHVQQQTQVLGADHEQHASDSHGDAAKASAGDSELALDVGSLSLSKTCEDRLSLEQCPIVDAQDMDFPELHEMEAGTELHTYQDCAATDTPHIHTRAYTHGLQNTTAAAAGPLMAADTEHMSTTAVADLDAATAHAAEMEAGTSHCSSWGLQAAQRSSQEAAQVTWLVGRTQLSVL